ncbi:MAG TPA: cupin domain-containing protein [Solirubrobacterales bacterium]|nr:cupin domain-containing protein [Solirubrobacterales bacterium]
MATVIGPSDGKAGFLGSIGVRFMIDGEDAGGDFSLVEHPLSARALAAPLHRHTREDEYSFVLEGRMGGLLGDDVVEAGPGDLVFKPRNEWHTFWNAGDEPCRILEIIAPAGFEHFFEELVDMGGVLKADPEEVAALNDRYGLEMKPETVPDLLERFGLRIGEPVGTALQLA